MQFINNTTKEKTNNINKNNDDFIWNVGILIKK